MSLLLLTQPPFRSASWFPGFERFNGGIYRGFRLRHLHFLVSLFRILNVVMSPTPIQLPNRPECEIPQPWTLPLIYRMPYVLHDISRIPDFCRELCTNLMRMFSHASPHQNPVNFGSPSVHFHDVHFLSLRVFRTLVLSNPERIQERYGVRDRKSHMEITLLIIQRIS
jgi:hypothetical protein